MRSDPTIEEQVTFYDDWNSSYRADGYDAVSAEIRHRADEILEHLESLRLRNCRILEIGCGTGWLTEKLCRFGEATAIDLSPKAIEIARSHDEISNYIAGNIFEYDFKGALFDVVVCMETLFYVEDQPRLVKIMAQLAKKGGVLALTTVNKFVYERSGDVAKPKDGQIRRWMPRRDVLTLVCSEFDVYRSYTVEPRGNMGILRAINSPKLNAILKIVFSEHSIRIVKEKLGLGGGVMVFGTKRADGP